LTEVDAGTRGDPGDWTCSDEVFRRADRFNPWRRPHTLDLFAAPHNAKCHRFFSRYYVRQALAIDAFAQDWRGAAGEEEEVGWACAPFALIPRILVQARESGARLTLVFPDWPGEGWRPLLEELRVGPIWELRRDDFQPGLSGHCEPWGKRGPEYAEAFRRMRLAFVDGNAARRRAWTATPPSN
jgi:hypothetical protein